MKKGSKYWSRGGIKGRAETSLLFGFPISIHTSSPYIPIAYLVKALPLIGLTSTSPEVTFTAFISTEQPSKHCAAARENDFDIGATRPCCTFPRSAASQPFRSGSDSLTKGCEQRGLDNLSSISTATSFTSLQSSSKSHAAISTLVSKADTTLRALMPPRHQFQLRAFHQHKIPM